MSLAPDSSNPDKVHIATGHYSASWGNYGVVYGSSDKENTWTKLSTLPFRLGANDPGRGICERMVVDPNKSNIIFLGCAMGRSAFLHSAKYGHLQEIIFKSLSATV